MTSEQHARCGIGTIICITLTMIIYGSITISNGLINNNKDFILCQYIDYYIATRNIDEYNIIVNTHINSSYSNLTYTYIPYGSFKNKKDAMKIIDQVFNETLVRCMYDNKNDVVYRYIEGEYDFDIVKGSFLVAFGSSTILMIIGCLIMTNLKK
jgi:hemolysin-activating ACP:hemolysin acyltransferase